MSDRVFCVDGVFYRCATEATAAVRYHSDPFPECTEVELSRFAAWLQTAPPGSICDGFYGVSWVFVLDAALPNDSGVAPEVDT